jgi:2-isopropylmalate synthase
VLGKHSGRHGLDARLRELGYKLSAEQLKSAYTRFVELADRNKHVSDSDLVYIAEIHQETPAGI